ncbi:MAG: hypothetical protein KC656_04920 [Myxococcales bacterium]|nr:hypothetical protein [Myxococcales bacterium]
MPSALLDLLSPWWPWIAGGGTALTVALVRASVVGLPRVLCGLPRDLLHVPPPPATGLRRVALNGLGITLVVLGVLMLVLPGQGLLTLLAGLLIADVPGKRRITLWLLRRPPVQATVNAIRRRYGEPPLDP